MSTDEHGGTVKAIRERAAQDNDAADASDKPKGRVAPRLGLSNMALYVNSLRLRATMMDGTPATSAWLLLDPVDIERLDDIARTLDVISMKWDKIKHHFTRGAG